MVIVLEIFNVLSWYTVFDKVIASFDAELSELWSCIRVFEVENVGHFLSFVVGLQDTSLFLFT